MTSFIIVWYYYVNRLHRPALSSFVNVISRLVQPRNYINGPRYFMDTSGYTINQMDVHIISLRNSHYVVHGTFSEQWMLLIPFSTRERAEISSSRIHVYTLGTEIYIAGFHAINSYCVTAKMTMTIMFRRCKPVKENVTCVYCSLMRL